MNGWLLDANVLIALAWRTHSLHTAAREWFAKNADEGWATCPSTECAFVRIISNPAFSAIAISPPEALTVLQTSFRHPAHNFWPDDLSISDAIKTADIRVIGHQQVTDAYLVGLAAHHGGKLATLDKRLGGWHSPYIEII